MTAAPDAPNEPTPVTYKLAAVMRQGTSNSTLTAVPYRTRDDARAAARELLRDDRVLRAMIVVNEIPPRFCEWVER